MQLKCGEKMGADITWPRLVAAVGKAELDDRKHTILGILCLAKDWVTIASLDTLSIASNQTRNTLKHYLEIVVVDGWVSRKTTENHVGTTYQINPETIWNALPQRTLKEYSRKRIPNRLPSSNLRKSVTTPDILTAKIIRLRNQLATAESELAQLEAGGASPATAPSSSSSPTRPPKISSPKVRNPLDHKTPIPEDQFDADAWAISQGAEPGEFTDQQLYADYINHHNQKWRNRR